MKRIIPLLTILALCIPGTLKAQEAISLSDCYKGALKVHPLSGEKQIQYELWQLKDKSLVSGWYPELDAALNILYNTNVTDFGDAFSSVTIPGFPDDLGAMPNENYKLTLDVNQVIWDGGAIKNSRILEEKSRKANEQDIEIELYKVREKINSVFFGLAILKGQKDLLNSYHDLIVKRVASAESAINNGLLLPGEKSSIIAEKIKIEQQIRECTLKISSFYIILSDLTGMEINASTNLILPKIEPVSDKMIIRPELLAIDYKLEQMEAGKSLLESQRMPKAFGFASLGYGSPRGNDFFSESFGPFAVFGAGIKWKVFDWNKKKRDSKIIDLNKSILANRRNDIEDNLKRALISKSFEIEISQALILSDYELLNLRKSITKASESQFKNGTITATEYMAILNLEKEAELSKHIHEINFLKTQVEYLNITGSEIQ